MPLISSLRLYAVYGAYIKLTVKISDRACSLFRLLEKAFREEQPSGRLSGSGQLGPPA